ncbi:MAG: methylmalonyl-CoA mutase [Deltaproteobacteria bacterium]|nr:methylmalonyl-CoA mutase [Deltaproteobacteria bacterium]
MKDNREMIQQLRNKWEQECVTKPPSPMSTTSGIDVDILYTPADISGDEYVEKDGFPGQYPFTRGVQPTMYRGRTWTMRQYSGFGTAEESNERYKFLLKEGQTGLSVAFDLPTQCGLDSDSPAAEEEVGRVGVAIDTLADMETLFQGIPLDQISTSFTINATAGIIFAMYGALGMKQGVPLSALRGTLQNDVLKEYIARGTYIFPPEPSLRLATDIIEYCSRNSPRFNPINFGGYHIREAGGDAVQEVAFTFENAAAYIQYALDRGMEIDSFAPRLSFIFATHLDLFEEVAKFRAARRIWARMLSERFGAKNDRSCMMRFHTQSSGSVNADREPFNNIVRSAYQGLASILGGAQSLALCSYDEPYAIPTEEAVRLSLRTQQILAHEIGATRTVDPLAGSYYVEYLTDELERRIEEKMRLIREAGGMIRGIQSGMVQREILEKAYEHEKRVQSGETVIVGVNKYVGGEKTQEVKIHEVSADVAQRQVSRLREVKGRRNNDAVRASLDGVREAAAGNGNTMPAVLEAVQSYATLGEIVGAMKEVFGEFEEPVGI